MSVQDGKQLGPDIGFHDWWLAIGVYTCEECGALVSGRDQHLEWHAAVSKDRAGS